MVRPLSVTFCTQPTRESKFSEATDAGTLTCDYTREKKKKKEEKME